MSQLQNKVAVLYVLENDAKSAQAIAIAQAIPEIYIQYVGLLSADQVPPWLKEVPTCVTIADRNVHTGTKAFELLMALWNARNVPKQPMPSQQQGQYPPQQGQYPPQQQGQQYPQIRGQPQGMPPGMPQYPPQMRAPPQQGQYPPQGQFPPQQGQYPPHPPQGQGYPPQGRPLPQQMMPQQPPQQPQEPAVKGSLQPASGSGQFGCSLDTAFMPAEDVSAAPTTDPRFTQGGKVNQNDMQAYLQLREQSGKIKSANHQPMIQ